MRIGSGVVERLEQLVGGKLHGLVAPLGGTEVARDDRRSGGSAGSHRTRTRSGPWSVVRAVGQPEMPCRVLVPVVPGRGTGSRRPRRAGPRPSRCRARTAACRSGRACAIACFVQRVAGHRRDPCSRRHGARGGRHYGQRHDASAIRRCGEMPNPGTRTRGSHVDGERQREERAAFARLQAGEPGAREALVERYLPLVRHLARRYNRASEPLEDLVQVGSIGLLGAIDRYDPDCGHRVLELRRADDPRRAPPPLPRPHVVDPRAARRCRSSTPRRDTAAEALERREPAARPTAGRARRAARHGRRAGCSRRAGAARGPVPGLARPPRAGADETPPTLGRARVGARTTRSSARAEDAASSLQLLTQLPRRARPRDPAPALRGGPDPARHRRARRALADARVAPAARRAGARSPSGSRPTRSAPPAPGTATLPSAWSAAAAPCPARPCVRRRSFISDFVDVAARRR